MGSPNYVDGFRLTMHENQLRSPLRWKKPKTVFVNSMSDLFHKNVSKEFILKIFGVMNKASQHRFQILTKRATRLKELNTQLRWAPNIWMGVSVENANYISRIEYLKETNAKVKFLSLEPLLGPLHGLDLSGIDWVIVGGESGPGARTMQINWVTEIRNQCQETGVPFFFKQWGGTNKKKAGRLLEGRVWEEMPIIEKAA
jgi:protein gp37